jgi:hypothetical protein
MHSTGSWKQAHCLESPLLFYISHRVSLAGLGRFGVHSLHGWLIGKGIDRLGKEVLETKKFKSSGKQELF